MFGVFVGFSRIYLLGILIFKGLTALRLYKSFGITGLTAIVLTPSDSSIHKNVHVKYSSFFSYFHGTSIFWSDFRKKQSNIIFQEYPCSGSRVIPCGWASGWTDMTKIVVIMRTQLTSKHCTRLSLQLGNMVHASEKRIVEGSQKKGWVCLRSAKRKYKIEYEMNE
jgi:hypothetical protein